LESFLEELKEQWTQGNFTSTTTDETAQLNALNIGKAQMITDILGLDYETLTGDEA
jgi:hypothetical protein